MEILYVTIHLIIITKVFCFDFYNIINTLPPAFPSNFKDKVLKMYSENPALFGASTTTSKIDFMNQNKLIHRQKTKQEMIGEDKSKITKHPVTVKLANGVNIMGPPTGPMSQIGMPMPDTLFQQMGHILSPQIQPMSHIPMPEMQVPQMQVRQMQVPQMQIPQTQVPQMPVPQMSVQQIPTPESSVPIHIHVPISNAPNPLPMPMQPMPMPAPMYSPAPIVMPMRTYYEPVVHQHPPLTKIMKIMKDDEELWNKYEKNWEQFRNEAKNKQNHHKPASINIDSSSSDTDTSDENRFDHWHYYDDVMVIKGEPLVVHSKRTKASKPFKPLAGRRVSMDKHHSCTTKPLVMILS